ncbi:MAG: hypothetical protein ABFR75_08740 [Acidobacteriota bacterium]
MKNKNIRSRNFLYDILAYIFFLFSILINRFWMLGEISDSVFRGVPNFYTWITLWNVRVMETFGFSGYWAGNTMVPYKKAFAFSENLIGLTPFSAFIRIFTKNPVFFTNLLSLLLVFLTLVMSYKIFEKLFGGKLNSVAGAIMFSLYPWSMKEFSLGRFHMLGVFWIPLILFFNIQFWKKNEKKYLMLMSLFWFWTFLINIYIGIFLTVFLLFFNFFWFLYEKGLFTGKKILTWGVSLFLVWLLMAPVFLIYKKAGSDLGMVRTLGDQVNYTGPLNSWITVPDENWLYGKFLKILPTGTRDGIVENYMFPGFIAILFFVVSFFVKRIPPWLKGIRLTGLFMAILSLGPFLPGLSVKIPLPFSVLWYIFPPLQATRNPHRFALFAVISFAILTAYLLKRLFGNRKYYVPIAMIFIAFISVESLTMEKSERAMAASAETFYSFLNMDSNDHIVAEIPFGMHTDLRAMAGSTYFWHRTVNGVSGLRPPLQTQLENEIREFPSEHSIKILQSLGVNRIVINERYYGKRIKNLYKKLENFQRVQFMFKKGLRSAWKLERGRKLKYLNFNKDFYIKFSEEKINKNHFFITLKRAENDILFNPKSPSKFKYTKSQEWKIDIVDNSGRLISSIDWNPPALFHSMNNRKKIELPGNITDFKVILHVTGNSYNINLF